MATRLRKATIMRHVHRRRDAERGRACCSGPGHGPTSPTATRCRPTASRSSACSSPCKTPAAPPGTRPSRSAAGSDGHAAIARCWRRCSAEPGRRAAARGTGSRRRRWRSRTRPGRSAARRPCARCSGLSWIASRNRRGRPGRACSCASASSTATTTGRRRCSPACVADPNVCDLERLKQAAEREVRARFVPPGTSCRSTSGDTRRCGAQLTPVARDPVAACTSSCSAIRRPARTAWR